MFKVKVKVKGFVPRTKVYRARKHNTDIAIHIDLTKRHYLLLKDPYGKAKNCKCRLCFCRYQFLALFSTEEWRMEIFKFPGRTWGFIIIGNSIINCTSLFINFLMCLSFRLDTYNSSYKDMFLVAGTFRIQLELLAKCEREAYL